MPETADRRVERLTEAGALSVCSYRDEATRIISLQGELDIATIDLLRSALAHAQATDVRLVVLDLRKLDFIDLSGLRVILEAHDVTRQRLMVVKPAARVHRLFELCAADRRLTFADELPRPCDHAEAKPPSRGRAALRPRSLT